ncbi:MAG: hypothetical protein HKO77_05555 [Gemmatimonadetes bacterium]|nr:hypothetical protein [Gemmatimonadota bacterium]NNL30465.1 hypothetical protein [Gemmatimonadota bacterium]
MRAIPLLVAASVLMGAGLSDARAQTPTMPSTLRYGSGLMDIPVSSVLPHLHVTGTLSGFYSSIGQRVDVGESGAVTGFGRARSEWFTDAAFAMGLLDRFETGVSIQSLGDEASGGDVWGLFGRIRLWEPVDQGLGLALGGRWLTSPSFGDGESYAPGRLGFPDERLRDDYSGSARGLGSELSLYAVASAYLRGFDGGPLPENDLSFTLGYGGGMFRSGGDLDFYAPDHTNGWFAGSALHLGLGPVSRLTLMVEHNGFDVNLGAQMDWDGIRIGAHYLATNHAWPASGHFSEYQKPKFGFLVSAAICPREPGFRCRPRAMRRVEPDTIYIPPPPPDTVVVGRLDEPVSADGEASTLCLSTGQDVPIRMTAAGDTLVGEAGISLEDLRPVMAFAGSYAGDAFWYRDGTAIVFEGREYGQAEDTFPVDCRQIVRVGVYEGVPVFATVSAVRPLSMLFIPVRPGIWRRYERGLG